MNPHKDIVNPGNILTFRNEIYGISALLIAIYHICGQYCPSFIAPVVMRGWGGVEVFLFLSSIGCWMSMSKNTHTIFYKHRFQRLGVTFLLIGLIWFTYIDLYLNKLNFNEFISNITLYNCFKNNPHCYTWWFVGFIALMYAIFPALFQVASKENGKLYISSLILISMLSEFILAYFGSLFYQKYEIMYSRFPIFLAGILFAKMIASGRMLNTYQLLIYIVLGVISYGVTFLPVPLIFRRWAIGVAGISFIIVYSWARNNIKANSVTKLFAFCGTLSLEIYMIHVALLRVFPNYATSRFGRFTLIIGTIILSWLTHLITNRINEMISKKH